MAEGDVAASEYEEITLADIVRVIHRRKFILIGIVVLALVAGVAVTVLTTPQYESSTTVVPLEQQDIIRNWLDSRHAAELVVDSLGGRLAPVLDAGDGQAPGRQELGQELKERTRVESSSARLGAQQERLITVTVELPDPVLARDTADAFIATLGQLRPTLENITRQQAFDQYYDGQNEQDAQRQAEVAARQKQYWLELDSANLPDEPSKPNRTLNLALAGVLGLMLGVFAVFFVEWLSKYRAEGSRLEVPEVPAEEPPPEPRRPGAGPGRRPPMGR